MKDFVMNNKITLMGFAMIVFEYVSLHNPELQGIVESLCM